MVRALVPVVLPKGQVQSIIIRREDELRPHSYQIIIGEPISSRREERWLSDTKYPYSRLYRTNAKDIKCLEEKTPCATAESGHTAIRLQSPSTLGGHRCGMSSLGRTSLRTWYLDTLDQDLYAIQCTVWASHSYS